MTTMAAMTEPISTAGPTAEVGFVVPFFSWAVTLRFVFYAHALFVVRDFFFVFDESFFVSFSCPMAT